MKIKKRNLVFTRNGVKYNVPLKEPWNIYTGPTKKAGNYSNCINTAQKNTHYIILNISSDCNLDCKYCFEKNNNIFGSNNLNFNPEMIIDFMERMNIQEGSLRFFGGEPLLNVKFIKDFVKRIDRENINLNYNIFTNGTLCNEQILSVFKKTKPMIFISIDGPRGIHNSNRPFKDGRGSYATVLKNAEIFNEKFPGKIVIRSIFDVGNREYTLVKLIKNLINREFYLVSFEFPWVSRESDFALNSMNFPQIKEQLEELTEFYLESIKKGYSKYLGIHPFITYLKYLVNRENMLDINACRAGYEALAVSVAGKIYPCHAFVGNDSYLLGNIKKGITNNNLQKTFANYSANSVPRCQNCSIKYFCNRRCPADSLYFNGNIYKPNGFRCKVMKEVIKSVFYIYYQIKTKFPEKERLLNYIFKKRKNIWTNV